ncbi:YggT family protein [Weissella diestrammenae]|uniref:YggT family protein n=1 Tax=Weissella diestrammenae TaxID=1162633 RepID=A0A7G9T631_9LACO|nr:YggT family protein [Weissella diestrammenae]MCM0582392.1 YggT family protein [Weissella diestrammenae]QNN75556.1 YggT family protein [Weissella diestrammenae]
MNLIIALLHYLIQGLELIIVISALMSWLPGASQSPLGRWVNSVASILVNPIRRIMPRTGMIDFSPLIALLVLQAAEMGIRMLAQILFIY